MTNMNQGLMANRSDTVAENNSNDITLTRYSPLQSTNRYKATTNKQENNKDLANQQQQASPPAPQEKTTEKLMDKPWTIAQYNQEQDKLVKQPPVDDVFHDIVHDEKQFQVVWTGLSFKVGLSSYDKLVNATLNGCRGLFDVGAYCGRRRAANQGDNSKSDDLFSECIESPNETQDSQATQPYASRVGEQSYEARTIFDNLNGYIKSGELSAILGPSGSGKTSLLNALCGRTENYGGRIQLFGGGKKRMRLSIIPQKDYLIENLTVRENLLYSSRLLNPGKNFDHEGNIRRVVRMLNLVPCFKSVAANISGGEYKRVSIAQELLRQPDILILDEPTSGLDSLNCKNLIGSLRKLISASHEGLMKPIAIVMTIHQPDVDLFHMFDHVYCMARGGRVIYDGRPKDAMHVIRSQANLTTDRRLSSQLANDSRSMSSSPSEHSNTDQSGQPGAHLTKNPANLLIEIASVDLYGQEPVDRLARYQLKQFEQLQESLTAGQQEAKALSQLQANLLSQAHKQHQHLVPIKDHAQEATNVPARDSQADQRDRLSAPKISASMNNNKQQPRSMSVSPSLSWKSGTSVPSDNSPGACTNKDGLSRDKRLSAKTNHSGLFWYHTRVLAQRAFVSTLRDPFMTFLSLIFHLSIPFVMWTVYPRKIGSVHGCPISVREMDIVSMASEKVAGKSESLQDEITTTLESSTMFFLTTYAFSMCAFSVAALAFPLNMHILLKEVRNGWYNMPSFVLGKTIANFPFEVMFPVISLIIIYVMLGMPSSAYEWRLWAIAIVMGLVAMISHTQGLIFGALFMDSVQTAVFLASAMSLPQTLLSGFTARIKHMPWFLQQMSWFSQYRYSSDLINMIRFGFDMCPCDKDMDDYLRNTEPTFKDVPDRLKPIFIYYLLNNTPDPPESLESSNLANNITMAGSSSLLASNQTVLVNNTIATNSSQLFQRRITDMNQGLMLSEAERLELLKRMEANEVDLFGKMADMIGRSFSFGRRLDGCPIRPQILITGNTPTDDYLPMMFGCMFALFLLGKILLLIIVRYKISSRV